MINKFRLGLAAALAVLVLWALAGMAARLQRPHVAVWVPGVPSATPLHSGRQNGS